MFIQLDDYKYVRPEDINNIKISYNNHDSEYTIFILFKGEELKPYQISESFPTIEAAQDKVQSILKQIEGYNEIAQLMNKKIEEYFTKNKKLSRVECFIKLTKDIENL